VARFQSKILTLREFSAFSVGCERIDLRIEPKMWQISIAPIVIQVASAWPKTL